MDATDFENVARKRKHARFSRLMDTSQIYVRNNASFERNLDSASTPPPYFASSKLQRKLTCFWSAVRRLQSKIRLPERPLAMQTAESNTVMRSACIGIAACS
jgi:hypothetical protein